MWESSKGEHEFGIEPISPGLDEDLFLIQLAKELGLSVLEAEALPDRWKVTVRILWAWQDVERKRPPKKRG